MFTYLYYITGRYDYWITVHWRDDRFISAFCRQLHGTQVTNADHVLKLIVDCKPQWVVVMVHNMSGYIDMTNQWRMYRYNLLINDQSYGQYINVILPSNPGLLMVVI